MIRFKRFILEKEDPPGHEHGLGNNAKGVFHEVLVGALLQTPDHKGPAHHRTLNHAEHFREAGTGKTPAEVHDAHKAMLTDEQYQHHYEKAKFAADNIRRHLGNKGGGIRRVHWTSNKDDIKRLTGQKDGNNAADLVVEHHDGSRTGLSMKAQKKSDASTLANPGQKTIDHAFQHPNSPINHHGEAYRRNAAQRLAPNLRKHGATLNAAGKITRKDGKVLKIGRTKDKDASIRGIEAQYPDIAEKNKKDAYAKMAHAAREYHEHISQYGPEHVEHALRHLAANDTAMDNVLVKTSGERGKFKTEMSDPQEDLHNAINDHRNHLHTSHSGTVVHFKGKGGVTIASLGLKPNSSGGFTSAQGNLVGIKKRAK